MSLSDRFKLPDSPPHVVEQLLEKDWGELEVLEVEGYLLFPAEIHKRRADGSFETIPVRLRVPREPNRRAARVSARKAALEQGLDLDRDKDLIQNLEDIHLLCDCLRDPKQPSIPFDPYPEEFEKIYDTKSIAALWEKLELLGTLVDPKPNTISKDEMYVLLAAIAKERNIAPLAVFGPDAQDFFIVTMADQLLSFMEPKSSSESSEPSMPG